MSLRQTITLFSKEGITRERLTSKLVIDNEAYNINKMVDDLIKEGELMEIKYLIPDTNRWSSLIVPKGTRILI